MQLNPLRNSYSLHQGNYSPHQGVNAAPYHGNYSLNQGSYSLHQATYSLYHESYSLNQGSYSLSTESKWYLPQPIPEGPMASWSGAALCRHGSCSAPLLTTLEVLSTTASQYPRDNNAPLRKIATATGGRNITALYYTFVSA